MIDIGRIVLIVSDVDGVWTDGRIAYVGDTREIKEFNVRDGLGVKIAQRAGIEVAVVTSRRSKALERRCRELGVRELVQEAPDKLRAVQNLADARGIGFESICYIGDDLPDLAPIRACALSAAPADAAQEVLEAVQWRLDRRGGDGAFRELVERILRQRGDWDSIIQDFNVAKIAAQGV
jgi:3-deoxy-D-manno-octulosonate 8-phosphate phosphatase (KDO 8-P phosphatase)